MPKDRDEATGAPEGRRPRDYRIDPFDLRLFTLVLAHGTITAAAEAIGLSLAAASARLAALEAVVGTPLLRRSKAGAEPTDAGRALARPAHRLLGELEALHLEMAAYGQGLRGTVRLVANTASLAELLPPLLARYLRQHPDIDLDVQELASEAVLDALRRGAADVGVIADHVEPVGLVVQALAEDRLVAVLPPGQGGAAGAASVRYAELLDRPFVGLPADSGLARFLLQQAARAGRVPRHRVRVRSFDAIAQLVDAGVGVAVMPLASAQRWCRAATRVVPLEDAWARRRLLACTTPEAIEAPGVRALVEALTAAKPD